MSSWIDDDAVLFGSANRLVITQVVFTSKGRSTQDEKALSSTNNIRVRLLEPLLQSLDAFIVAISNASKLQHVVVRVLPVVVRIDSRQKRWNRVF